MLLTIRNGNQILTVDIGATSTVEDLKRKIFEKEGIPISQQKLMIFGGITPTVMSDSIDLTSYGPIYSFTGPEYSIRLILENQDEITNLKPARD